MAVGSDIDATVPADNVQVDKALLRANFAAAKDEIEGVQAATSLARQIGFGNVTLIN